MSHSLTKITNWKKFTKPGRGNEADFMLHEYGPKNLHSNWANLNSEKWDLFAFLKHYARFSRQISLRSTCKASTGALAKETMGFGSLWRGEVFAASFRRAKEQWNMMTRKLESRRGSPAVETILTNHRERNWKSRSQMRMCLRKSSLSSSSSKFHSYTTINVWPSNFFPRCQD